MAKNNLNHKQRRFVREYLKNPNATQSALAAGYSPKTAYSIGQRLLKHVEIGTAIREGLNKLERQDEMDAVWIRRRIKTGVERCMDEGPFRAVAACQFLTLAAKVEGLFHDNAVAVAGLQITIAPWKPDAEVA